MDLYFITGISGSGKTTVARKLQEMGEIVLDSKVQPGLFHFADVDGNKPGDYKPHNKSWSEKYQWKLDKPMFDRLLEENKGAERIFVCGGSNDLMRYWLLGKKVFLLKVDSVTVMDRLSKPDRDNDFAKDKATQKSLAQRVDRFQKRQIEAGAIPIDALRSVEEVARNILLEAG